MASQLNKQLKIQCPMNSGEVGGQELFSPLNYIFVKNGIFEENFDFFLPKNNIFFPKKIWDLSGYSQICCTIFKKILTPPTSLKFSLTP